MYIFIISQSLDCIQVGTVKQKDAFLFMKTTGIRFLHILLVLSDFYRHIWQLFASGRQRQLFSDHKKKDKGN